MAAAAIRERHGIGWMQHVFAHPVRCLGAVGDGGRTEYVCVMALHSASCDAWGTDVRSGTASSTANSQRDACAAAMAMHHVKIMSEWYTNAQETNPLSTAPSIHCLTCHPAHRYTHAASRNLPWPGCSDRMPP